LYVWDNMIGIYPSNYALNTNVKEKSERVLLVGDSRIAGINGSAFMELIWAVTNGNGARWESDNEMGHEVLSLLKKMGIDTTREFTVNGIRFLHKDGAFQTLNYAKPMEAAKKGTEYLNDLLIKAYERNSIYED